MRALQHNLKQHWDFDWKKYQRVVPLEPAARQALLWWCQLSNPCKGMPLGSLRPELLFTDTCGDGWEAHPETPAISGRWTQEYRDWHINALELLVVILAIVHFQHQLRGRSLLIATDKATTLSYIRNQDSTKSSVLVTRFFFSLIYRLAI